MPDRQTAVTVDQFNAKDPVKAVKLHTDFAVPGFSDKEVLVKVTCRPINPADVLSCQGSYPSLHQSLPSVPGIEGVGVVEEVGKGVQKQLKKGQRVVGVPFPLSKKNGGTWQQYVAVHEDHLATVPNELSDEAASQIYVNPVTVRGFYDVLQIPEGEHILQSAAGSVLGRQVIQFAKHYKVKTINVVRRAAQKKELLDLGADEVIVAGGEGASEDIAHRVKDITGGKGAYGAVDCVGGELTGKLLAAVRPRGTLLVYGAMGGLQFEGGIPDVLFGLKVITGFHIKDWRQDMPEERFVSLLEEVVDLMVKGVVTPYNGNSYPLEKVTEALQEAIKPARGGKVFLKS